MLRTIPRPARRRLAALAALLASAACLAPAGPADASAARVPVARPQAPPPPPPGAADAADAADAASAPSAGAARPPAARPDMAPILDRSRRRGALEAGFDAWVAGFRGRALARGIRAEVFDRAFRDVRFNARILLADRSQAEFVTQIWDYLAKAVSPARIANGRAALREHRGALERIEARYGVEAEVLAAIWGLETAYGSFRGETPTIEALAALAYDPRRGAYFEEELLAALRILQSGEVGADEMIGSWAGAMGHTQFMPISYIEHAQDFDGDGRRDVWGEDPADALASAAAFLAAKGWTRGQPWAVEVVLPEGFDYALAGKRNARPTRFWARRGVARARGGALPEYPRAAILLPAGHRGPAFMAFDNFRVISRYNASTSYVMGVGLLADAVAGRPPTRAPWPRGERALSFEERKELQRRLRAAGFDPKGVDGIIGAQTAAAVRAFQRSIGWVPDGYPSARLLERLRAP